MLVFFVYHLDMNGLQKIDNIMYRVKDLKTAGKFYAEVLGLKKVWEDEKSQMIAFMLTDSNSEIVIHTNTSIPDGDYSYSVENVEQFVKDFKAKGYRVALEPIDVRPGKYAVLLDPDGNKIPIIDLTKFDGVPKYD